MYFKTNQCKYDYLLVEVYNSNHNDKDFLIFQS